MSENLFGNISLKLQFASLWYRKPFLQSSLTNQCYLTHPASLPLSYWSASSHGVYLQVLSISFFV